ncbi:MAG: hypothetical protein ABI186_08600, partial [Candidatus Elarobacter sp.]
MTTAVPSRPGVIDRLASTSHVWVAASSVLLVVLMIVPIAPWVLDLLLRLGEHHPGAGHPFGHPLHRE